MLASAGDEGAAVLAAVTFGPIVLVAAGYLTKVALGTLGKAPLLKAPAFSADAVGLALGPAAAGVHLQVLPYTKISMRSCLMGAILVVPLWRRRGGVLGLYVARVAGKIRHLAMALLPLFCCG